MLPCRVFSLPPTNDGRAKQNEPLSGDKDVTPHEREKNSGTSTIASTTGTSECLNSTSELATTLSSFEPQRQESVTQRKGKGEYVFPPNDHNGIGTKSQKDASSVFEMLQSQYPNEDIELTPEDISTWVSAMETEPRQDAITNLISRFDSIFLQGGKGETKTCTPAETQGQHTHNSQSNEAQPQKSVPTNPGRGKGRAKTSQTSNQDNESSKMQSLPLPVSTYLFPKMLSCPFVKYNPARYVHVNNSYTERFGFPNPGKLV